MTEVKGKFQNGLKAAMDQIPIGTSELARQAGTSRQNIDRWKKQSHKLPIDWAIKLAPLLDVSEEALIFNKVGNSERLKTASGKKPKQVYIREWRKFMGVSEADASDAIDVELQEYRQLERAPYKFTNEQMALLADAIGVHPNQFWFKPPAKKGVKIVSLDELIEDASEVVHDMAIAAVRGMVGK